MNKGTSKKPSANGDNLAWADTVNDHCRNIITLAQLLGQCGHEEVAAGLVNNAGWMIEREAEQLQAILLKTTR